MPGAASDVDEFDGPRMTIAWSSGGFSAAAPTAREACAGAIVGDKLVCFGGLAAAPFQAPDVVGDTKVFDFATKEWVATEINGDAPLARTSHTMTTLGTNVYAVFGMHSEKGYLRDTHVFDTTTMTWSKPLITGTMPSARDKHSVVAYGEKLVLFGGFGLAPPKNVLDEDSEEEEEEEGPSVEFKWHNDTFVMDTTTRQWAPVEVKGTPPTPRAAHGAVVFGNTMYVFGGRDVTGRRNDLHALDLDTMTWREIEQGPGSPSPRSFHSMCGIDGGFLVFGGLDATCTHLNDSYFYNIKDNEWKGLEASTALAPNGRGNVTAAVLGSTLVVFGGSSAWDKQQNISTQFHADTFLAEISTKA